MNNRFKFRVWDVKLNQYVPTRECDRDFGLDFTGELRCLIAAREDHQFIFQQYTGLTDINDVPIYEGDLVELHAAANYHARNTKENHYGLYVIYWDRKYRLKQIKSNWFLNVDSGGCDYFNIMKVIGNIFQNPELLK